MSIMKRMMLKIRNIKKKLTNKNLMKCNKNRISSLNKKKRNSLNKIKRRPLNKRMKNKKIFNMLRRMSITMKKTIKNEKSYLLL